MVQILTLRSCSSILPSSNRQWYQSAFLFLLLDFSTNHLPFSENQQEAAGCCFKKNGGSRSAVCRKQWLQLKRLAWMQLLLLFFLFFFNQNWHFHTGGLHCLHLIWFCVQSVMQMLWSAAALALSVQLKSQYLEEKNKKQVQI